MRGAKVHILHPQHKNNEKNKGENVQIVTQMSRCGKYERLTSQGILMNWKLKINKIRSKVGVYIWWEKKERERANFASYYNAVKFWKSKGKSTIMKTNKQKLKLRLFQNWHRYLIYFSANIFQFLKLNSATIKIIA